MVCFGCFEGLEVSFQVEVALGAVFEKRTALAGRSETGGGTVSAGCVVEQFGSGGGMSPQEAVVLVEVGGGVEGDVDFHEAGVGFDAHVVGHGAEVGVVGTVARAIGVLQEEYLLFQRGSEEDTVFGQDGVVVCCCVSLTFSSLCG